MEKKRQQQGKKKCYKAHLCFLTQDYKWGSTKCFREEKQACCCNVAHWHFPLRFCKGFSSSSSTLSMNNKSGGFDQNLWTHFVDPERALLKVAISVKLVMHEGVPAVCVYIAGLLHSEVAGRETADLRPCNIENCFMQPQLILFCQYGCKQSHSSLSHTVLSLEVQTHLSSCRPFSFHWDTFPLQKSHVSKWQPGI